MWRARGVTQLARCISGNRREFRPQIRVFEGIRRCKSALAETFDGGVSGRTTLSPTAHFGWTTLHSPSELKALAHETIDQGNQLLSQLLAQPPGSIRILELLDDLSDLLCRVADPATYIRQLHPDTKMHDAAIYISQLLGNYIEQLNTHTPLYLALKSVRDDPSFSTLSVEEQRTTIQLLHDFEKSGISLPKEQQREVVELCEQIQQLEFAFESKLLEGGGGSVDAFQVTPSNIQRVLCLVSDPETRLKLHQSAYTPAPDHGAILDAMLGARHRLATVVGYQSFGESVLVQNMVSSPNQVQYFLREFWKGLKPRIDREVGILRDTRRSHGPADNDDRLWAHDRPYYTNIHAGSIRRRKQKTLCSDYFSVGRCFEGINMVTQAVFGVTLRPVSPVSDELWHPSVSKLVVEHEEEGELGIIYCDMYARDHKTDGPAHYSILNSREVRDAAGQPVSYQKPMVVLTCSFLPPSGTRPTLLSLAEVETLFHEMGHALHSMFGRTKFQTVAGTRCPLDFVELPSQLFEMYARDYRVVSQFATHYKTGEPIPEDVFQATLEDDGRFIGLNAVDSVIQSMVDQMYHSADPLAISTTDTLIQIQREFNPLDFAPIPLQFRYGHLCGYAAAYYSYLWCQALASMIWTKCFHNDPLNRESGDLLRKHVLAHGNARPPWKMVEGLLGNQPSMDEVVEGALSRWNAKGS